MSDSERLLPADGPGAPPRANGELVFAAPWENRVFGMTLTMLEAGRFEWPEFQQRLIAAIARHEREIGPDGEYHYYACWLEAFCELAGDKGWVERDALGALEQELEARPAGHDH